MSNITLSIPPAAQELLRAISSISCANAQCSEEIIWKNGTYLHPKGKVVFQGMVTPGDTRPDGTNLSHKISEFIGFILVIHNHCYYPNKLLELNPNRLDPFPNP